MSCRCGIVVLVVALLARSAPLSAGRPKHVPIQPIGLYGFGGEIFVRGETNSETQTSGRVTTKETDTIFEEGLKFKTSGYIYHPNLLDWWAGFRLATSQEEYTTNETAQRTHGSLNAYDLSAHLLKEKPISLRLFTNHSEDLRDRDFAHSARIEEQRRGFEILTHGPFPVSLLVEDIESMTKSDLRIEDERIRHYRLNVIDRRNHDWLTEFSYDREEKDETVTPLSSTGVPGDPQDLPETIDEGLLANVWRFGSGPEKHTLSGRFRFLDRRGFFMNKIFAVDQRVDLVHDRTFSTFYEATYSRDETETELDTITAGGFGFTKTIFDSLEINGQTNYIKWTFLEGENQLVGASLGLLYRKKTPIGRYTSSFLIGRQREEQKSAGGKRFFRDDSVALNGMTWTDLSQPNIDVATIVVTDIDNSIPPYVTPGDYETQVIGATTQIRRLLGGDIGDGETVLVDYNARVARDATFRTDRLHWENRLQLKKLPVTLYHDSTFINEDLEEGDNPGNLDHEREHLLGVEVDFKGLVVAYEHEIRDQNLSPSSVTDRVRADYHRSIGGRFDFTLGALAENISYSASGGQMLEPGDERLKTLGGHAAFNTKIGRNTLLSFDSSYVKISGRENDALFRNTASLRWQYGKLDISIEANYDAYEQEQTTGNSHGVMFYLRRSF